MRIWLAIGAMLPWRATTQGESSSRSRLPRPTDEHGGEPADDSDDLEQSPGAQIHPSVGQYLEEQLAYVRDIAAELEQEGSAVHAKQKSLNERREWERRGVDGALTVFRVVRVTYDGDEGLATCRNISDAGMKLDLSMPLALNDLVEVAFSPSISLSGHVVWRNGHECGIAFERKVDSAALLSSSAAEAQAHGARSPRLKSKMHATVVADGHSLRTLISDISQRGMKLTHDGQLYVGLQVKVLFGSGKAVAGVVRWSRGNDAGLYLLEPLSVMDLGSVRSFHS